MRSPYLTADVAAIIAEMNGGVLPADAALRMEISDDRFVPPVLERDFWYDDTSLADLIGTA